MTTLTIKQRITDTLLALSEPKAGILKRYKEDNRGPYLAEIYFWQEVCKLAESREKIAWVTAQSEGLIPADDQMRNYTQGEHIVAESKQFSCLATLTKARENFNREKFILAIAKKYKLNPAELTALAETCREAGKVPLSKRVVEV